MRAGKTLFWMWVGLTLLPLHQLGAASQWEWQGVDRVVVLGDVHGSYDKMMSLLFGTGVVDATGTWTGGDDHLVFVGDITDRGPDDRQVMDLLMQLQPEAQAAGGRVHVLLGNHEVMNMVGDLRYVDPKGFADFAKEEEKGKERELVRHGGHLYGLKAALRTTARDRPKARDSCRETSVSGISRLEPVTR